MKIAFTADLHLTNRSQNPERFETLENLLADLCSEGVEILAIAGDLFDSSLKNYSEFEQICRDPKYQDLSIAVIPGNHDPTIDGKKFVANNLKIINEPWLHKLDGRTFLFLPYQEGKTMGEGIEPFRNQLPADKWVLVAHGDWAGGLKNPNPTEPGVYMPLTRQDIEIYQPARVFLGHIHIPWDSPPIYYVGSPCGLDITETGRRRCLIYDTATNQVKPYTLNTPIIFLNESFVVVPVPDEAPYLCAQIKKRLDQWGLSATERAKTQLRVKVSGFSADKSGLRSVIEEAFAGFIFYEGKGPDLDSVSNSDDIDRQDIAEQVQVGVDLLDWPAGGDEPSTDEILLKALHIIYGR